MGKRGPSKVFKSEDGMTDSPLKQAGSSMRIDCKTESLEADKHLQELRVWCTLNKAYGYENGGDGIQKQFWRTEETALWTTNGKPKNIRTQDGCVRSKRGG